MAKAITETLDAFKQRMADEGFEPKEFPGHDPRVIVRRWLNWWRKNKKTYDLCDEFHPEDPRHRNTWYVRRKL